MASKEEASKEVTTVAEVAMHPKAATSRATIRAVSRFSDKSDEIPPDAAFTFRRPHSDRLSDSHDGRTCTSVPRITLLWGTQVAVSLNLR